MESTSILSEQEEPNLDQIAFLCDDLGLDETQKACARYDYTHFGPIEAHQLIECVEKNGKVDGIMESALLLPLREYLRVKEIWENAEEPYSPPKRRRK